MSFSSPEHQEAVERLAILDSTAPEKGSPDFAEIMLLKLLIKSLESGDADAMKAARQVLKLKSREDQLPGEFSKIEARLRRIDLSGIVMGAIFSIVQIGIIGAIFWRAAERGPSLIGGVAIGAITWALFYSVRWFLCSLRDLKS